MDLNVVIPGHEFFSEGNHPQGRGGIESLGLFACRPVADLSLQFSKKNGGKTETIFYERLREVAVL